MNFKFKKYFCALGIFILFTGCAVPVKFSPGLEFIRSSTFPSKKLPAKIQARLKTVVYHDGKKSGFTTLLSAIPKERYRLEFKGPLGNHMGDFYWVQDSNWVVSIPSEDLLVEGSGKSIQLPFLVLDSLDIHFVLGFLWGQLAQEGKYKFQKKKGKTITGLHEDNIHSVDIHRESGQVVRAADGVYTLKITHYTTLEGRAYPEKVALFKNEAPLLSMEIKKINYNPTWKRSPFRLN